MIKSRLLSNFKNISHGFFNSEGGYSNGIYKSLNCGIGSKDKKRRVLLNLKKVSKTSCPPRYENTEAKVHEPTNNHIIIALVFAVRKTDSLKFFHFKDL